MQSSYLNATNISKAFSGLPVLDRVNIEVEAGHSLVLLGPSGCGKTTLLRIIAGLEAPDAGTITINGEVLAGTGKLVPPEQRQIGMVFQEPALFPHLTVSGNIAFGLGRADVASGRVEEALAMVGLVGLGDRRPETLSGGQAQRVALARALAPRPRVLLFDEPFSSLDSELRAEVRTEVAALLREIGVTAVFVTHDQEEAFVLGDTVAVMRQGRILQAGSPSDIYGCPASRWVATFVGEANIIPGSAEAHLVSTALGSIRATTSTTGTVDVVVRPEHIKLSDGYDATVLDVDFFGHDSSYRVMMRGVEYTVRAMAAPDYRPGDTVDLEYRGPDVVAFADDGNLVATS